MFSSQSTSIKAALVAVVLALGACSAHAQIQPNQINFPTGTSGCVYDPGSNLCTLQVESINSITGAFTFTGSGVSCSSTTCTFTGGSTTPGGSSGDIQWNSSSSFAGGTGWTYPGTVGQLYGAGSDTYTGSTTYSYLSSILNGLNWQTEYRVNQPGDSISAIGGGIAVPDTATNHQAQALAGIATNSSPSANVVGGYFASRCLANGTSCWGSNPLVSSATGLGSGTTLIGEEVDVNVNNAADSIRGIFINGAWTAQPSSSTAVEIGSSGFHSAGQFGEAFVSDNGSAGIGLDLWPALYSTNPSASQQIVLRSRVSSTVRNSVFTSDTSGNFLFTPYSNETKFTGTILLTDSSCTSGALVKGDGTGCSAGSTAFSAITGSTNTTAAMLVGAGASLEPTSTGTVQANNISGTVAVTSPITIAGSGTTASPYTIACPTCGTGSGGTSVSQNSGSAETNLPITGYMPQLCADSSGSGTAQSCSTANTFTPQTGNCVVYSTTTANSGTGLTVNVNSLGAKSVAAAGSSGWSTTLVASLSVPAAKPMHLCYDGTHWNASGTGYAAAGSSSPAWVFDEMNYAFGGSTAVTSPIGPFGFLSTLVGSGAAVENQQSCGTYCDGRMGIMAVISGSVTNSYAIFQNLSNSCCAPVFLSSTSGVTKMAMETYVQTSSTSSQSIGLSENLGAPNPGNYVAFVCDPNDNSGSTDWYAFDTAGSVNHDTGVACTAWHQLEIVINDLAVTWYIDNVSVGVSATAPAGQAGLFATSWSHSTTPGTLDIDWIALPSLGLGATFE